MKLIDEKGKLFGRINVIDLAVVLVVIVLAVGVYVQFGVKESTSVTSAMQPVTYEVAVEGVRPSALENLMEGDTLYDQTSGNPIGTITAIRSQQAQNPINLPNGTVIQADAENRIDLFLTVEADAVVNAEGTFVGRTYELLVGSTKNFYTKYVSFIGAVSQIGQNQ